MIFMNLVGPDIFSTLWMKGQVLHREQVQVQPNPRRLDALDGKFGVLKLAKSFIT